MPSLIFGEQPLSRNPVAMRPIAERIDCALAAQAAEIAALKARISEFEHRFLRLLPAN
jgi:hypothetical protein